MLTNHYCSIILHHKEIHVHYLYLVVAVAQLPAPLISNSEKRQALLKAHRYISEKYDSGVPFFTMAPFRDIVQQLDNRTNETRTAVSLHGLDKATVEFPIQTDEVYPDAMAPSDCIFVMYGCLFMDLALY